MEYAYSLFAASTVQIAAGRVAASWEWYVIRASGFVAAGLLILLMISGIGHVTGFTYRFLPPLKAWAVHKAMAYALLISIAVHGLFVLLDKYVPFSFFQIFIPFLNHYNNGTSLGGLALGSLAVSFGILAMYGIVLVVLTSLGMLDKKPSVWRRYHLVSYLVVLLVFLHGLYIGTDLKYGTFRGLWIGAGAILLMAVISRLARTGIIKKKPERERAVQNIGHIKLIHR